LIDGIVIDETDVNDCPRIDLPVLVTGTMMRGLADRERLAGEIIAFAGSLVQSSGAMRAGGRR